MNSPQQPSDRNDRQRMHELQAIPERDRTDAQWDELHELEISLAPGNREGGRDPNQRRPGQGPMQSSNRGTNPNQHPRPNNNNNGGGQGKKQGRRFHRPKRPAPQ
jgi:hypothetical protein